MFSRDELLSLDMLRQDYSILVSNGHDIRLQSKVTGHEWIIISPYNGSSCEILHRHTVRNPFHHQQGKYDSLLSAIEYIRGHDQWYSKKRTKS